MKVKLTGNVTHDGTEYGPDDVLDVTSDQAEALKRVNVAVDAPDDAAPVRKTRKAAG